MHKLKQEPQNPLALGGLISANVITPLNLDAEDHDFVDNEIKWLFSAIHNFQQVHQRVGQRLAAEENKLNEKLSKELAGLFELRKKRLKEGMAEISPQIWQEEIEQSQSVAVAIPQQAERKPQADNKLSKATDIFWLESWPNTIEHTLKLVQMQLGNLKRLLDQEIMKGTAGKEDVALQNQIKSTRIEIIRNLQTLTQITSDAYGVSITSPKQLLEFMEQS